MGRDSTALIELIKNAYDADATSVTVHGYNLGSTESGYIQISDTGTGMGPSDFLAGFLRIASRIKDEGDRRSRKFGRRFTGAKGIGRLAAHKLARFISVHSIPHYIPDRERRVGVDASIDWDKVEKKMTLDQVEGTDAIIISEVPTSVKTKSGTTITLRRLRKPWTDAERSNFVLEVQSFTPPSSLVSLPDIVSAKLLNKNVLVRDSLEKQNGDPGLAVNLEGVFSHGDDLWDSSVKSAHWLIEIDARDSDKTVHYSISPTKRVLSEHPETQGGKYSEPHPDPEHGPFFQGRILVRTDKSFHQRLFGIRVFMEGFRVLPYGSPGDDWLLLDRDYTQRGDTLRMLKDSKLGADQAYEKEGLSISSNKSYAGAIFLTANRAPSLRMLVNREGFVPEVGYQTLADIVRKGIDLSTRLRAAAKQQQKKNAEKATPSEKFDSDADGLTTTPQERADEAVNLLREAKGLTARGELKAANSILSRAVGVLQPVAQQATTLMEERSMLRVVASIGTQFAGFIHEIRSLVGIVHAVDQALAGLRAQKGLNQKMRNELGLLHSTVADLRKTLERHASYLVDVVTPDVRRRRKRMSFSDRFDSGVKIVAHIAEKNGITIRNEIDISLESPPMFPAELTVVFANLLTNAIKAAGNDGKIKAWGIITKDECRIVIENTGVEVSLKDSEKWFEPFESTTTKVDPVLGQGMGLGLSITRSILEEYGAAIRFISPSKGYSTAIEMRFE